MLSLNEAVDAVAKTLGDAAPPPDESGDSVFELADDLKLRLRALPDGRTLAWAAVSSPPPEKEAEEKAAEFLRMRLARLRGSGAAGVTATAGENGEFLLYATLSPGTAESLVESVTALLNEAEAMRRLLSGGGAQRSFGAGAQGLFAGMADFFKK